MIKIVGVRFKNAGKIYYFDPVDFEIEKNIDVVVETARGLEYGKIVVGPKEIEEEKLISPLKPIIRIATEEDKAIYRENKEKAKETFEICQQKIKEHGLTMFLIDCEYTFDRNKLIFYFTAEGRIDFRELVKDLASIFKTRIELRQIGVRDEAKSIGGLGTCGRKLCCSSWLGDFQPVSIKMAKDQSLSLNPTKISGICGRLFCCLKYEHDVYVEAIEKMPVVGSVVKVENQKGKVIEINPLLEQI
ncbi:PSP1 domain-containing protein, partial [Intestinibacter bartlettii]